jgi:hypothetical protein
LSDCEVIELASQIILTSVHNPILCLITDNLSFDYPSYPGAQSTGVGDYSVCDRGNTAIEFYTKNGYDPDDQFITKTFNILVFPFTLELTCLQALQLYTLIDPNINPYPPPDDYDHILSVNCCLAFRYRTDLDIVLEVSTNHDEVVLNIEDEYTDSERFVELCEELWACTAYIDQYSFIQCEADPGNRGCEDYVDRSFCFNQAYDPDDSNEIKQRKSFIIETCLGAGKFRLLWSVS